MAVHELRQCAINIEAAILANWAAFILWTGNKMMKKHYSCESWLDPPSDSFPQKKLSESILWWWTLLWCWKRGPKKTEMLKNCCSGMAGALWACGWVLGAGGSPHRFHIFYHHLHHHLHHHLLLHHWRYILESLLRSGTGGSCGQFPLHHNSLKVTFSFSSPRREWGGKWPIKGYFLNLKKVPFTNWNL